MTYVTLVHYQHQGLLLQRLCSGSQASSTFDSNSQQLYEPG